MKTFKRELSRKDIAFFQIIMQEVNRKGYCSPNYLYQRCLDLKLCKTVKGYYAFLKRLEYKGLIVLKNGKIYRNNSNVVKIKNAYEITRS